MVVGILVLAAFVAVQVLWSTKKQLKPIDNVHECKHFRETEGKWHCVRCGQPEKRSVD